MEAKMFRHIRQCLLTFWLVLVALGAARADGLFVELPAPQSLAEAPVVAPFVATRRMREVALDADYLAMRIAPPGSDNHPDRLQFAPPQQTVRIELFPGVVLDLEPTSITAAYGGGYIWTGEAAGPVQGWADLVIADGRITGHVTVLHPSLANYRIDPVAGGGIHRITELDPDGFPPEGPPHGLQRPDGDQGQLRFQHHHGNERRVERWRNICANGGPRGARARMAARYEGVNCDVAPMPDLAPASSHNTIIDVMIVYTPAAWDAAGGRVANAVEIPWRRAPGM